MLPKLSLPLPIRDGYTFNGWFTAETGGSVVTHWTVFESDVTIYAQWTAIVHGETVTYGGEIYQTEVIGTQTWFTRNLNYAGEAGKEIGVCYNNSADSCAKYGRLYNKAEAMAACPVGWHLPSDAEWTTLTDFVGSNSGRKLRSPLYWDGGGSDELVGTDDYGFSALPGGECEILKTSGELFCRWANRAALWHDGASDNWAPIMFDYSEDLYRQPVGGELLSVRCVKD
jgi:uncharacterized protein (TIGR02145 family)/uncharacterized repeat protein (TIGR02543 family)